MYNKHGNIVKGRYTTKRNSASNPFTSLRYFMRDNTALLQSGYTVGQTWEGLDKAWLAFVISMKQHDEQKMIHYAGVIQKLQRELVDAGLEDKSRMANFPQLKMYALGELKDNAKYLYDERVGLEPSPGEDHEDPDMKRQRNWLNEVYNSDGLERVRD
jgi:hypothetical protein